MGVLLLVRHGQASLGTADYDRLSDIGRRQAQVTGARLAAADLTVDRVVCGTLTRQRDTAEALLAALGGGGAGGEGAPQGGGPAGGGLRVDGRLDEYDHVGVMAGTARVSFETAGADGRALQSALEEAIGRWMSGSGGAGYAETHDAFLRRAQDAVRDLAAEPGTTVAVTSGGVIAAITAQALGLPAERWPGLARLLVNASITKIITGRTGRHLLTFNDHAHLESDRSLITYR